LIREALFYSEAFGWPVFPVSPFNKRPMTEHGHLDATTDPDTIRRWWWAQPNANLGVRCDSFFVVDIDPRSGGNESWERLNRVESSIQASTANWGKHLYFKHDKRLESIPLGRTFKGIDIKGGGRHYVLLPPSRFGRKRYRWMGNPAQTMPAAPEFLIKAIVRAKTPQPLALRTEVHSPERQYRRATAYLRQMDPAVQGQGGSKRLWRAACTLTRDFHLGEQESLSAIQEWNRTCQPMWSENELRRAITRSAGAVFSKQERELSNGQG